MRICFVGHVFHQRTRSSDFFIALLRTLGQVEEFFSDPDSGPLADDRLVEELASSRYDLYVFWQTELVAERILPLELGRSILVPMYDSVADKAAEWWTQFVKPQFISFSRAHHEALQRMGCRSSYFQYFPDPGPQPVFDATSAPEGFFWNRRPSGPINTRRVVEQCRLLGIRHLHIHHAPDVGEAASPALAADEHPVTQSASTWSPDRTEFDRQAAKAAFFFAPRPREGIGMANLEAMARGQIVVAPDLPTINEYVAHRVSGLLYDPHRPLDPFDLPRLDAEQRHRLGHAAWRKIAAGRAMWLSDVERLLSIIADDGRRWFTTDYSSTFARHIRRAAHERVAHAG